MRKHKISTQLIILFTAILFFSSFLFSVLVISRLQGIYLTETLNRLNTVISLSKSEWDDNSLEKFSIDSYDMEIAYIRYLRQNTEDLEESPIYLAEPEYSSNLTALIKEQVDVDYIINEINKYIDKPGISKSNYKKFNDSGEIFFSFEISEKGNIIVLITNTSYANHLRSNVTSQVIFIFTIVLIFSSFIIVGWSKTFTTRIARIKQHVKSLPQTNYEQEYVDCGNDEISDLSKSIETMRISLKNTENDKREMLQNISHDFKTPISVIKSYAEAINDGMSDDKTADVIISQATLLQAKVNKLLQYNRLEYLSKDEEFVDVNMKDVINSVVSTYRFQTNVIVYTNLEDVYYKGYMENYYTVIDNIIDNAKRYAKTVIRIDLTNEKLVIYNDGEHIDDKFLNGMFNAYEKGSNGQFGLGMSIAQKTLNFFNYDIEVKNEAIGVSFIIKKKIKQNINAI